MKLSKCHFFTKEIQYLGHILSTKGIRPLPSKTQAIQNMHPPKTSKQVCTFLGLIGYYRKFIWNFAKIAKPLTLLTQSTSKFQVDTNPSQCFSDTEGISYPSTNTVISKSNTTLYSIHRCIRWCMCGTTITGIQWDRIPNSFSFT